MYSQYGWCLPLLSALSLCLSLSFPFLLALVITMTSLITNYITTCKLTHHLCHYQYYMYIDGESDMKKNVMLVGVVKIYSLEIADKNLTISQKFGKLYRSKI